MLTKNSRIMATTSSATSSPHRPAEGEEADRDEQQDDREEDRLGNEAAESGPLVGVQVLVVANRQAMPRLYARGVAGRIVPYPATRR